MRESWKGVIYVEGEAGKWRCIREGWLEGSDLWRRGDWKVAIHVGKGRLKVATCLGRSS